MSLEFRNEGLRHVGKMNGNSYVPTFISHRDGRGMEFWPRTLFGPEGRIPPKVVSWIPESSSLSVSSMRRRPQEAQSGLPALGKQIKNTKFANKTINKEEEKNPLTAESPVSVITPGRYGPIESLETGAAWCQHSLVSFAVLP